MTRRAAEAAIPARLAGTTADSGAAQLRPLPARTASAAQSIQEGPLALYRSRSPVAFRIPNSFVILKFCVLILCQFLRQLEPQLLAQGFPSAKNIRLHFPQRDFELG